MQASEAQVANTRLQLSYTEIRAPITGRTGSVTLREGNLVAANGTNPLLVLNQIAPIYATFSVPEQALAELRGYARNGRLPVQAVISQTQGPPENGTLAFIDNTVDNQTGTIRLKATFANPERRLWPGQFVNVTVTLTSENVVTVPTRAVQRGQRGDYVFVVAQDMKAQQRPVQTARLFGEKTILAKGVRAGERVITDGQVSVKPGVAVARAGQGQVQGNSQPLPGSNQNATGNQGSGEKQGQGGGRQ